MSLRQHFLELLQETRPAIGNVAPRKAAAELPSADSRLCGTDRVAYLPLRDVSCTTNTSRTAVSDSPGQPRSTLQVIEHTPWCAKCLRLVN